MSLITVDRVLIVLAVLWVGVMAGFFIAFTALVMPGLADIDPGPAMAAMQGMNAAIDNPWFGLSFFGAVLLAALVVIVALVRRDGVVSLLAGLGGVVYLVFLVTVAFSVPLNNDLDRYDPAGPEAATRMTAYIADWSRWNDVRCITAVVAFALLIAATILAWRQPTTPRLAGAPGRDKDAGLSYRAGAFRRGAERACRRHEPGRPGSAAPPAPRSVGSQSRRERANGCQPNRW